MKSESSFSPSYPFSPIILARTRPDGYHALSLCSIDTRADIVVTSLGSDEGVEAVYAQLFGGQEVRA